MISGSFSRDDIAYDMTYVNPFRINKSSCLAPKVINKFVTIITVIIINTFCKEILVVPIAIHNLYFFGTLLSKYNFDFYCYWIYMSINLLQIYI